MKHESNDTPPFAPDDPISRSLFVRPSLIERLCASALRLCLLVCIPAAASVFLISLADSAEAACTSEPSQHYEVTTLIADHPVQTSSDPDFEEILKANARIAVESGEWSRRVKRKEETLIQWMRSPVFPEFRPMAVKTTLIRRPTGLSVEDIRRAELFNDVRPNRQAILHIQGGICRREGKKGTLAVSLFCQGKRSDAAFLRHVPASAVVQLDVDQAVTRSRAGEGAALGQVHIGHCLLGHVDIADNVRDSILVTPEVDVGAGALPITIEGISVGNNLSTVVETYGGLPIGITVFDKDRSGISFIFLATCCCRLDHGMIIEVHKCAGSGPNADGRLLTGSLNAGFAVELSPGVLEGQTTSHDTLSPDVGPACNDKRAFFSGFCMCVYAHPHPVVGLRKDRQIIHSHRHLVAQNDTRSLVGVRDRNVQATCGHSRFVRKETIRLVIASRVGLPFHSDRHVTCRQLAILERNTLGILGIARLDHDIHGFGDGHLGLRSFKPHGLIVVT